ncbi:MAG: UDP-N-acetylglucosamine pyrophosphorylase [Lachnospiraceae bacterium]|nr:UDP-N-acetylglucosamine pyrophosphorylase [Lachnospiraceae bacterium]
MEKLKTKNVFVDLTQTQAYKLMAQYEYPWEVLPHIGEFILEYGKTLSEEEYDHPADDVWIHKSCKVFPTAYINGPCIIGKDTEVRQCAFIRGNALVGEGCVVGNSTELKNVIIFNNVEVPHYNYVGDSILGYHSHMGAGSITSNIKADRKNIEIMCDGEKVATGMRKIGAILGDWVEIGCGTILNPGSIVGHNSNVYPLSMVRGYVEKESIYKKAGEVVEKY